MASIAERNAAFDVVKALVLKDIPSMFQGMIKDEMILEFTDAALTAAEKVRTKQNAKAV